MTTEHGLEDGRVAVVTGAASGIGRAVAEMLAMAGAMVVIADRDGPQAQAVAGAITAIGHRAAAVALDVSDPAAVSAAMADVARDHGLVRVLVNSAGIAADTPFLDTDPALLDRIIGVNLRGTMMMGQAVARGLIAAGMGGSIINLGSVSGLRGNRGRAAYGASKGGVHLLTQVMALELGPHGIRVNCVAPGPIDTPLTRAVHRPEVRAVWEERVALNRYGTPEEIALLVRFLAGDAASYVTGQVIAADGGFQAVGIRG
ncbi:SDR family NAD(P)-dependent oxidoreductase [Tistrella sp. BH-R2-4]|jgi:NAD(P)-dependent dehydrogenase (short-subunit alcohol dehydrogenase family)|uniref:SDR family NAD(P)-dependent oxidoreductase n=1 Tax=Tistrella arctica TaxID=3133430 RepID=A0ABU9YSB6_9PROT